MEKKKDGGGGQGRDGERWGGEIRWDVDGDRWHAHLA